MTVCNKTLSYVLKFGAVYVSGLAQPITVSDDILNGNVDMWLQHNKIHNLRLAVQSLDGIIIQPEETFSYWRLLKKPTKRRGYVEEMQLTLIDDLFVVSNHALMMYEPLLPPAKNPTPEEADGS
ncbi:hypothetical protein ABD73_16720 [Brevibacillus laterosporus]|nr:hypothetical protein [Brevibacillus laterosporus]